jgi:hypothetical protein
MFTRLRYAAHVLSSPVASVPAHERPDITFEDVKPSKVSAASRMIAKSLEILIVSGAVGYGSASFISRAFMQKEANVTGIAAVVGSLCTLILNHFHERLNRKIGEKLRISDRLAPYFGRKIAKAYHILRG